jgi:hypothetical protein
MEKLKNSRGRKMKCLNPNPVHRLWTFIRKPMICVALLCFVVRVASLSEVSEVGTVNITAGGIAWVTTMEGGELEANEDKISLVEQGAEADKFMSMESMLQWAIGVGSWFSPFQGGLECW